MTPDRACRRSISAVCSMKMSDAGPTYCDKTVCQWRLILSRNHAGTGRPRKRRLNERVVCPVSFLGMPFWMANRWPCQHCVGLLDARNRAACICCRLVAVVLDLVLRIVAKSFPCLGRSSFGCCFLSACFDLYLLLSVFFLVWSVLLLRTLWFVSF